MSLFKKAVRSQAKLRLALIGPAGSGKTFSSLAIAKHLVPGGRIAVLDSERGSAELYASEFDFDTMELTNHSPMSYVEAIGAAEAEGYDVIVCDSLSHAWMGKDGALEQVDKAVERGAGNSFSAWRSITPKHNALVDKILSCKAHFIATIRAKTEYVQEKNDKGKTEIKKLGMQAIQRDGLEYEFTLVGDLDLSNTLKISKTRLNGVIMPGDIFEKPGEALASRIRGWLNNGAPRAAVPREEVRQFVADMAKPEAPANDPVAPVASMENGVITDTRVEPLAEAMEDAFKLYLRAMTSTTSVAELDRVAGGPGKPTKGTPEHEKATDVYKIHRRTLTAKQENAA